MKLDKVIISGGAGFLGSHLCRRLLADGLRVHCIDNYCTGQESNIADLLENENFTAISSDITSGHMPAGERFDAVLHFASPASPPAYLRYPVETLLAGSTGTARLLDLARENNARFLLASTSEVYGNPLVHPQPESYWGNVNPVGPRSVYDEAKRFAEALTTAYRNTYGLDTAIVRIFNSYGPGMHIDDGRMIPTFIGQALNGKPITVSGTGEQTRSICYIDDTVDGIVRMLYSEHSGPINIGSDHEMTVLGIAELVREVAESDSPITFVSLPEDDPAMRRPDLRLARTALRWEPRVGARTGLERTVSWFRTSYQNRGGPVGRSSR